MVRTDDERAKGAEEGDDPTCHEGERKGLGRIRHRAREIRCNDLPQRKDNRH